MKSRWLFAASAVAGAFCSVAHAEGAADDAAVFGARGNFEDISLSPSGNKIAYIGPSGPAGEAIYVVDLTSKAVPKPILNNSDGHAHLRRCDWATEARLVCRASIVDDSSGLLIGFTRVFAIGADGSNLDVLTRSRNSRSIGINQNGGSILALDIDGKPDMILMSRERLPERSIGTRMASKEEGLGVDEVDINNEHASKVEPADRDAVRYVADDKGRVRLKVRQLTESSGNLSDQQSYFYRTADSDRWVSLGKSTVGGQTTDGFYPVAVDATKNVAYAFDTIDGYDAVVSIALDGTDTRNVVVSRDDVDVDTLIRIGRRERVVGASFATEKREVVYFDPELRKLAAGLAAALPGKPLIDIVDASEDESKLLIIASSDVDPGMSYLYDKKTRQLNELLPLRDGLDNRQLGKMTPVSFPAADGTQIPGYLTLPPGVQSPKGIPAIVLPHGGPSARDEWGFDWLVQFFAARGYAVLQPNYRGSSGYGSAWFGRNGFKAWRTAIGDVNDAGRWLVSQGIADPDKLAIVGWSYGGYGALQSQVLDAKLYKAVVAIAPVTDLDRLREESRDFTNFSIVDDFIGHGPEVKEGSPAKNVDAFMSPVMLVHGTIDQNVGVGESRLMDSELRKAGKKVEYLEFDDLDHQLDSSTARAKMLMQIDGFLSRNLAK